MSQNFSANLQQLPHNAPPKYAGLLKRVNHDGKADTTHAAAELQKTEFSQQIEDLKKLNQASDSDILGRIKSTQQGKNIEAKIQASLKAALDSVVDSDGNGELSAEEIDKAIDIVNEEINTFKEQIEAEKLEKKES